ncbi:MAG TPA: hypothetical protein VJ385_03470 [Fibrobacteria bacterium]|nr:hypothetical protein [Fibrobacteria bacterium]
MEVSIRIHSGPVARLPGPEAVRLDLRLAGKTVPAVLALVGRSELDSASRSAGSILHPNERVRFRGLERSYRKQSALLGWFAVKTALAHYLEEPRKNRIEIAVGPLDQPLVKYPRSDLPDLTMSHSRTCAGAIAYAAGHVMGIDVEDIDPSKFALFRKGLTGHETRLADHPGPGQGPLWILLRTAREALGRAIRCEPSMPGELLSVNAMTFHPRGRVESSFRNFAHFRCCSWILPGSVLSIVLPRSAELNLEFGGTDR